jgi:hypothetical protein
MIGLVGTTTTLTCDDVGNASCPARSTGRFARQFLSLTAVPETAGSGGA